MEKNKKRVTTSDKPNIAFFENENNYLIIDAEQEVKLDNSILEIENYIKSIDGKGKTEEEKDEFYKNAQVLWNKLKDVLTECKYNFYLNRVQYKFLTDVVIGKLEYDVNTVFFAIELTNLLGNMKGVKYLNDKDLIAFPVNATEITYIYHLISQYKVKGLTRDAYTFSQVLLRIGEISKVFNYYDIYAKNLAEDVTHWAAMLGDDSVTSERINELRQEVQEEVADAEVIKPASEE